jgi:hypothetical protein
VLHTLKEGTMVEERDSTRGFFSDGACDCDGTTAGLVPPFDTPAPRRAPRSNGALLRPPRRSPKAPHPSAKARTHAYIRPLVIKTFCKRIMNQNVRTPTATKKEKLIS